MGLIQAGMGVAQTAISAAQAGKIGARPEYALTPEMRDATAMAKRAATEGASAEERASFAQSLERQGTAAKQMFRNVGMAGAGAAAANIMSIDALNQFAAQNQAIKRQNLGMYSSMAARGQQVVDANTQAAIQERQMLQQQAGQGMQSGMGNIFGGINSMGNAFGLNKAMDMYKGMGVGGSGTGGPGAPAGVGGVGGSGAGGPAGAGTNVGGGGGGAAGIGTNVGGAPIVANGGIGPSVGGMMAPPQQQPSGAFQWIENVNSQQFQPTGDIVPFDTFNNFQSYNPAMGWGNGRWPASAYKPATVYPF